MIQHQPLNPRLPIVGGNLVTTCGFKVRFKETVEHEISDKNWMDYRHQIDHIIVFLEKDDESGECSKVGVREVSKKDLADKTKYYLEGIFRRDLKCKTTIIS